jgi:iron complex transport system substrate-binding protein
MRIVSLLPAATEIVAALGFADALVGRSHECDFPAEVADLPVCTEPKVDPRGGSDAIHSSVSALLAQTLSVYRVDAERLRDLVPTHVVTQVQCEVCAVSLGDVEAALSGWTGARPRLTPLNPGSLADVFDDMERVAVALDARERGRDLVAELRRRIGAIADRARGAPERPTVATVEWFAPLMAAGNWMPELVELAGGRNLFGRAGEHSPWLDFDEVRRADPDVVIAFPCGFPLEKVTREAHLLTSLPGFSNLKAARSGCVYLADGNRLFNRPGPGLVETLEALSEILHPDLFRFGHEGVGWIRLSG